MKYCKVISIILLAFFVAFDTCTAQLIDNISDLSYSTRFEENTFVGLDSSFAKHDLALLLASNPKNNKQTFTACLDGLNLLIEEINTKDIRAKRLAKATKLIHNLVKKRLLKKYQSYCSMEEVFVDGTFNCVTGTAVYALIFKHFDIPFTIYLEPNHVYLLVDPDHSKIVIESTDHLNGFKPFTGEMKLAYLLKLQKAGLMESCTIKRDSIDVVFDRHYFKQNATLNISELAGIQYFNCSMKAIDDGDLRRAVHMIEKSDFLFSQYRNEYIYLACLTKLVNNLNASCPASLKDLFKLANYQKGELVKQEIYAQFKYLGEEVLIKEDQEVFFDEQYHLFMDHIHDLELSTNLTHLYFQFKAKASLFEYRYSDAFGYIKKAFGIQPNNLENKHLISSIAIEQYFMDNNRENATEKLLSRSVEFPFLENHPSIKNILDHKSPLTSKVFQTTFPKETTDSSLGFWLREHLKYQPSFKILDDQLGLFEE